MPVSDQLPPAHAGPSSESAPALVWSEVFIERRLPWSGFLQSAAYHVLALAAVWAGSRFLALQPHAVVRREFIPADVVYYTPSEYLPPLDTLSPRVAEEQKPDPEFSEQPIISVPPESDNHAQTIVTPPNVRLPRDVALPNTVAWSEPRMPIAPAPTVLAAEITRLAPQMDRSVIAPPPEVRTQAQPALQAPQPAVIGPPPMLEAGYNRRVGDLNVGHSAVIAPAPQLSLDEQRALTGGRSGAWNGHAPQVIAPPPSLAASGGARSGTGLIALSLYPAVGAPPNPPAGNRRGTFAATPNGRRGASGAPGASHGDGSAAGAGGRSHAAGLPSGLYVGKSPATDSPVSGESAPKSSSAYPVNPNLIANARPPRVSSRTMQPANASRLSEEERAVFGDRKFYSLSLNMPNLNSGGGSWIIRFAALDQDSSPPHAGQPSSVASSSGELSPAELSSPVATRKVDPAYPLELMRQNVGGTVILYGVIRADGTVGNLRVLRSVDDRLDQFAREAIAKWQFQPATKNGTPVDVEATFWIPFKPTKVGSNF